MATNKVTNETSPFIEDTKNNNVKRDIFPTFTPNPKTVMILLIFIPILIFLIFIGISTIKNIKIGIIPLDFYWSNDATDINNITREINTKKNRKRGKKNIEKDKYKINIINSDYNSKNNVLVINNDKIIQLPMVPDDAISIIIKYRRDLYNNTSIF